MSYLRNILFEIIKIFFYKAYKSYFHIQGFNSPEIDFCIWVEVGSSLFSFEMGLYYEMGYSSIIN